MDMYNEMILLWRDEEHVSVPWGPDRSLSHCIHSERPHLSVLALTLNTLKGIQTRDIHTV